MYSNLIKNTSNEFKGKRVNVDNVLFFYGDVIAKERNRYVYDVGLKFDFFFPKEIATPFGWYNDKIPGFFLGYDYYFAEWWRFFLFHYTYKYVHYRFYFLFLQNIFVKNVFFKEKFFFDSNLFFFNFFLIFYRHLYKNYFASYLRFAKHTEKVSFKRKAKLRYYKFIFKNLVDRRLVRSNWNKAKLQRKRNLFFFFQREHLMGSNKTFYGELFFFYRSLFSFRSFFLVNTRFFWAYKPKNQVKNSYNGRSKFLFFIRTYRRYVLKIKERNSSRFDFIGFSRRTIFWRKKRRKKKIIRFLAKVGYLS